MSRPPLISWGFAEEYCPQEPLIGCWPAFDAPAIKIRPSLLRLAHLHPARNSKREGKVVDPFFILAVLACLTVLVVLALGLGGFAGGGAFNKKNSNKLMRYRIAAQFVAIIFIVLFVYFRNQGG